MALLCDRMGISVWEMLDAAFTKPFGIQPFYPGPGVGGALYSGRSVLSRMGRHGNMIFLLGS